MSTKPETHDEVGSIPTMDASRSIESGDRLLVPVTAAGDPRLRTDSSVQIRFDGTFEPRDDETAVVATVSLPVYDPDGRLQSVFLTDAEPIDRSHPVAAEDADTRTDSNDVCTGGADDSADGAPAPIEPLGNGITVDASGERDTASRNPFADRTAMRDLARRKL